jgi:hypothetical protein
MSSGLMVRRGITRTVLLVHRWAIKVPSMRSHDAGLRGVVWSIARGLCANLSEQEWSGSPGTCPVLWSWAGIVNVYPRCQPVTHDLTDAEYDAVGLLGPGDRKPQNMGWLDGRLVWVDYDMNWNDRLPCEHVAGRSVRALREAGE